MCSSRTLQTKKRKPAQDESIEEYLQELWKFICRDCRTFIPFILYYLKSLAVEIPLCFITGLRKQQHHRRAYE